MALDRSVMVFIDGTNLFYRLEAASERGRGRLK
jgi:hypothetical protein